jgi:hypothetical protein
MPLSTARSSRQGGPRLSGRRHNVGKKGPTTAHCSSVRSRGCRLAAWAIRTEWLPRLAGFPETAIASPSRVLKTPRLPLWRGSPNNHRRAPVCRDGAPKEGNPGCLAGAHVDIQHI